jgi:PleD family two-component response regulator
MANFDSLENLDDFIDDITGEGEKPKTEEKKEQTKRKIIVVDDIKFYTLSIKERFKTRYDIFPAHNAEDLFDLLENVKPELILLDINIPDCNGYEILKKLKGNNKYAEIPVIFLTSEYSKQSIVKGMGLGAVDFVKKPFADADLIKCIEHHLDPVREKDNKPVILAIDDNPTILKAVNSLLRDKYSVYTLPEPTKITALLEMVTPDLFLLDCQMPGLSGFDLIPMIRKIREHEETPIVFLSSEGTINNISAAIDLGACDFITKPINENILRDKTALHLKDYNMRRRIRALSK